jgi:dipeptidyl-peptidase-4
LYSTSLDTRDPAAVTRISREPGWHDARLLPGARRYLDLWSSPEQPPSASLRRLDGTVHRWLLRNALDDAHPYAPYRPAHAPEEYGSLRADDGQTLYFRLQKPADLEAGKRYPVVIDTYGGPHFQYVRKDWMGGTRAAQGYFRQMLTRNGFVVFTLDNRGSGFRGSAFETAIAGRLGEIEVRDQLRGVEFLRTLPFVDADRIGIMGWSYGGYLSLMAVTTSAAFKAGVAGAPVTDWSLYDTHYTERYLGMPEANAEGYRLSNVLTHAEGLRDSLLLVHGMADDNVLFTHSTLLMQRLQALGKPFDLMTYPGAKHSLGRMPGTGRHYHEMVLRFFQTAL